MRPLRTKIDRCSGKMILACSAGHEWETDHIQTRMNHGDLKPRDRCPMLMSYDRMSGSTYCRRILKERKNGNNISK
jgi:hypothetical protein